MTFKDLLKQYNFTQHKLSKVLKVSQPCISNWSNGINLPTQKNMQNIAEALKIDLMLVIQCFYK